MNSGSEAIRPNPLILVLAVLVLGTGLGLGVWVNNAESDGPPNIAGTYLRNGKELPPFTLTDDEGKPFTRSDLIGRWSVLYFGYTHCPDVCPTTLAKLSATRKRLRREYSGTPPLQVVFVSVDPVRDRPERLKEYVHAFNAHFVGATGDDQALAPLVKAIGISYTRHEPDADGQYAVNHSPFVVLVNPRARLQAYFRPPHRPRTLARQLYQIMETEGS